MPIPLKDALKNALDSLLGSPEETRYGLETDFGNLTPSGLDPLSPWAPPNFQADIGPSTAELSGIIQKRERGFDSIDITPFKFGGTQFQTTIPLNDINEKIGYDYDAALVSATGNATTLWRSVTLPRPGNFLKLQMLPGKINSSSSSTLQNNPLDYRKPNEWDVSTGGGELAGIPSVDLEAHYSPLVLIQFDDPGAPIIVARDGDSFKLPFVKFTLTFKIGAPRFSVIIGNSAETSIDLDNRAMNSELDTGPGYGLWTNPARNAQPACFSQYDQTPNALGLAEFAVGGPSPITYTWTLLDNNNFARLPLTGCGVGWITCFTACFYPGAPPTTGRGEFSVYLQLPNGVNVLLTTIPYFWVNTAASGNTNNAGVTIVKSFTKAIRFQMPVLAGVSSKLIVVVSSTAPGPTTATTIRWNLDCYLWGKLHGGDRLVTSSTYFGYGYDVITSLPYPTDFSRLNS